ncbi:MAG: helix-turn-helix domain-containing protein [Alphaproteobacteria bacterium]|nr:helix-turn-helix domain-containing protein [Alphaproteobacteria bacterium]
MRPSLLEDHPGKAARVERSRIPASFFRTQTLPEAERFAAWRESVGVFLEARLDGRADPAAFAGDVESYLLDDIVISRPRANGQKFDRPSGCIARDGLDSYMIQLFVRGGTEMALARRSLQAEKQLVGFDLGETLDSVNSDFDIICAVVPRARLAPLLVRPDSLQGAIPSDEGGGRLLAEFIPNLFGGLPDLAPQQTGSAARALTELIATAFNGESFAENDAPEIASRALELKAKAFVKGRLGSHTLDPDEVAAAMGLSRSALYRLFKDGGGIAFYIREQRLRRCFADLVSERGRDRQIAEIAWRRGFADAAHFSRLFKERFGCAPSQAREGAFAAQQRRGHALDARVGDRRYEDWIAGLA